MKTLTLISPARPLWLRFIAVLAGLLAVPLALAQSNVYPPPVGYALPVILPATPWTVQGIATVDLGPNLFTASVATVTSANQLHIFRNDLARGFRPPVSYATGPNPVAVQGGLFRGNGRPDLFIAQAGSNTVRCWLANGDGTLGAYHDYPCGGQNPRQLVMTDQGVIVVNENNIALLATQNNFGTSDPAAVLHPAAVRYTVPAGPRDLSFFDFDGQSIEVFDAVHQRLVLISNGPDDCFLSGGNSVVIANGSMATQFQISEPVGKLMKMQNFLCLYLPQTNRIMRLAFGNIPEMNGATFQFTRLMPSGNTLTQSMTYNYFDLPAGATFATSKYVDVNFADDLIVSTPGTNSLNYYLNVTNSGQPVPVVVPLGVPMAKVETGVCDYFDLNYDFAVLTSDGRVGVSFSGRPPISVTTGVDEDNGTTDPAQGTGTSLREALNRAATSGSPATIRIATTDTLIVSQAAEDDPVLGRSAFVIGSDITILSPPAFEGGISYAGTIFERSSSSNAMRLFRVTAGGRLSVQRSFFRNWLLQTQPGSVLHSAGQVVVDQCAFQNNISSGGGCVAMTGGTLAATNSTFANSSGAFQITGGTATLTHLTMAYLSDVSPLYLRNADVTLVNSLIGYFPSGLAGIDGTLNAASHHNIVGQTVANLGMLGNNSGQTPTVPLLPGCPAIDAGVVVAGITTDQREFARTVGAPDVGAFEFSSYAESLVVTTDADENNGTSDPRFGLGTSLREALAYAQSHAGDDTITFEPAFFSVPRTLYLTLGSLSYVSDGYLTITGPAAGFAIDGQNASRILSLEGEAELANLTFRNGTSGAGQHGGAIHAAGGLTMAVCTLHGNQTPNTQRGGAIYSIGSLTMTNCTLANNVADAGGAIYAETGAVLIHVTIAGNTASSGRGGVEVGGGQLDAYNSVSCNNLPTATRSVPPAGPGASYLGCVIDAANPLLGPLATNGGPGQTIALLAGSPAVNAGTGGNLAATDARGVARVSTPDSGAYELAAFNEQLTVTTIVDEANGTTDPSFGTGTGLREAITYAATLPGPQVVTFAPALAGQSVQLRSYYSLNAVSISSNVVLRGPASGAGITLVAGQPGLNLRHFAVEAGGLLTLENLTLRGGRGQGAGGSILSAGQLTITGCTFTDNSSTQEGGAIHASGTSLVVTNSTFAGNSASSDAAAIAAHATACSLQNVTIIDNIAGLGAALSSRSPALLLRNTLVARNTIQGAIESNVSLGQGGALNPASSHNLFGPGAAVNGGPGSVSDVASTQLQMGALASNGGTTQTAALLAGSPAVNAGTATGAAATDQRGKLRPQFGVVDIGAVEQTAFDTGQTIVTAGGAAWYLGPDAVAMTCAFIARFRVSSPCGWMAGWRRASVRRAMAPCWCGRQAASSSAGPARPAASAPAGSSSPRSSLATVPRGFSGRMATGATLTSTAGTPAARRPIRVEPDRRSSSPPMARS